MLKYTRKDKRLRIPVGLGTNNNIDASLLFNVSDGDAKPEDLLAGKTAYSSEGYITGTLDVESEKTNSYNEGYTQGEQDGYVSGEADGFADGYTEGKEDGIEEILTEQSDADITPSSVAEGKIGYGKNNERIVGTNIGGFDFGEIGYTQEESTECNETIKDDIAYTKSLMNITPSTSLAYKFKDNTQLAYAPYIDTSITTDMSYMFTNCSNLKYVPQYDYSNVKNLIYTFKNAAGPAELDFSFDNNIETFQSIVGGNTGIKTLIINASAAKENGLVELAGNAKSLKHLDVFNITSNIRRLDNIINDSMGALEYVRFSGDTTNVMPIDYNFYFSLKFNKKLHTVIFDIDTHFLKDCNGFFAGCSALETTPYFNTANATNMMYMFQGCTSLKSIPQYDTSKVTTFNAMFDGCQALENVPLLEAGSCQTLASMFSTCYKLTNFGGLKDLGKSFTNNGQVLSLEQCYVLTRESALNVFNNVYDMNLTTITDARIRLYSNVHALLSSEDIAIATNKGWTIQ